MQINGHAMEVAVKAAIEAYINAVSPPPPLPRAGNEVELDLFTDMPETIPMSVYDRQEQTVLTFKR